MKSIFSIKKEFNVRYLKVSVKVRYLEDSTINGVEDSELGELVPCKEGDEWKPIIGVDSGWIINWEQGKKADIHYKVCDEGTYELIDENNESIIKIDGYVPKCMCPASQGYGDYIIMNINEDGFIKDWKPKFDDFSTDY